MFKSHSKTARTVLPILFFGALVSMLVVSENLGPTEATTIIINTPELEVIQDPAPLQPLPRCKENSDCPLPTTYCGPSGKCTELIDPVCDCSQPQVLRCYEQSGKARFLFCANGCSENENGAVCQ